ncbi:MAG: type II toxin-antitoxin system HicB family antitoxin [Desulfovibrio sp.]|jgi:predicted RNase H-like HicB family nuclease|nr:type II toxin-antitoxin system HicB family antitoxin [Desulfovibrio sp.]
MIYYFAVFIPAREGGYSIAFPDFPEAISQGEDLSDCMLMAADALALTVEEYGKARRELPPPSNLEDAQAWWEREREREDEPSGIDAGRPALFQLFAAPEMDATPVRISVSLTKSVLAGADQKAKLLGLTRSGFLAAAAQAYNPMLAK